MGDAVVMQRMTVGMVTMARRKTRFPTDIGSNPTEAKPTASVTAFCVYLNPLQNQQMGSDMHIKHPHKPGYSVRVAISRRRYPQQDKGRLRVGGYYQMEYNAFG